MYGLIMTSQTFGIFEQEKCFEKGRNDVLPRKSSLVIFGLLVCYAAVTQIHYKPTPTGLASLDDLTDGLTDALGDGLVDDLDSVCTVASTSKDCIEHETFHSWDTAHSEDDLNHLEHILLNTSAGEATMSTGSGTSMNSTRTSASELEGTGHMRGNTLVGSGSAVLGASDDHDPLMKKIRKARCEVCIEPRHRDLPTCAEFQKVTSCEVEGSVLDEIDHVRCEMCMEPQHRDYPECAKFRSVSSCKDALAEEHRQHATAATWAAKLVSLQVQRPRRARRANRAHPRLVQQHAEDPVVDHIENLGCEMCLEPSRRDNPHCMRFLNTPACKKNHKEEALYTIHVHELSEEHRAWEATVEDEVTKFRRKLCSDPARRAYHACADFVTTIGEGVADAALNTAPPPPILPTRSLRGSRTADERAKPVSSRGTRKAPAIVSRSELTAQHSVRVGGVVPTVAAISVLRPGYGSVVKVPHLVKGFKNQSYEGPNMLMLVYHYQDDEVGKAVGKVADGSRIFAVPTRGDFADIHSPASFRFGAWRAEKEGADLIARWDSEAYHSPKRLEMQVRAIAHTQRPACVLHQPGTTLDTIAANGLELGERTLVGQARWMRRYYSPHLDQTEAVLTERERNQLVVLDMPELFVFVGHHNHPVHAPATNATSSVSAVSAVKYLAKA